MVNTELILCVGMIILGFLAGFFIGRADPKVEKEEKPIKLETYNDDEEGEKKVET